MKRAFNKMGKPDDLPAKVRLVERNVEPQGIPLIDPEAVGKTSKQDLVALATEIEKAENFIKEIARNRLRVIAEEIKYLRNQAQNICIQGAVNMKLHHVACNFVKHPGHVYHLYQRQTGQLYLSMLSPGEWAGRVLLRFTKVRTD